MKKILFSALCLMFFGCAFSEGYNLKITKNTEKTEIVSVWLKGVGFTLKPFQSVEVEIFKDCVSFDCSHGVATVESSTDTTLELNPDCYYVGEKKFSYWGEDN